MYEEARHEPLIEAEWNPELALETIERIVRDTLAHFDPQYLWPVHPLDRPDADRTKPFRMLYFGAAGVIWALNYLHQVGATTEAHDFSSTLAALARQNRADLNLSEPNSFSYLMGDVGIQLVQWRANPTAELADAIFRAIELNIDKSRKRVHVGRARHHVSRSCLCTSFTGEERWKEVYVRNVGQILNELVKVTDVGCCTWTQDLYGQTSLYLGAVHGFAANIFSIVRGREILDPRNCYSCGFAGGGHSGAYGADQWGLRQLAARFRRQEISCTTLPRCSWHDHLPCRFAVW